ncbi:MAG TPA: DedA family protein, partial [Methylomirabilota bacterium]|nr:DedA family protein [Methylomirabilota bacterium]
MSPIESLHLVEQYGLIILPAVAVAEQIGIPLPAAPILLAVGALAAHGRVNIVLALLALSVVALATDLAWYELGRRHGANVLERLYRCSSRPDHCRRRAAAVFARHGARSMLVAKFLPGLTTILPPLAGVFAVGRVRFVLYDLAGVLVWALTWLSAGYFFSDAITLIASRARALGHLFGLVVVVSALIAYVLFRYGRRRRALAELAG